MRRTLILCVVLVGCLAGVSLAAWNAAKQQVFVERLSNISHQFQDSREECQRLIDIYVTEGVEASPDFVDHPSGITTVEMTALKDYCLAFVDFNENIGVPAANRRMAIVPFLSTRVRP